VCARAELVCRVCVLRACRVCSVWACATDLVSHSERESERVCAPAPLTLCLPICLCVCVCVCVCVCRWCHVMRISYPIIHLLEQRRRTELGVTQFFCASIVCPSFSSLFRVSDYTKSHSSSAGARGGRGLQPDVAARPLDRTRVIRMLCNQRCCVMKRSCVMKRCCVIPVHWSVGRTAPRCRAPCRCLALE